MEKEKTVIGITHGDINGIGYEVIIKTLAESQMTELFTVVIYGSSKMAAYHRKNIDAPNFNLNVIASAKEINPSKINIINCVSDDVKIELGQSTQEAGQSAFAALERATEDLKQGLLDTIVTAPINKNNIQSEAFRFPGHTEYLEQKFGNNSPALMMLVNNMMRVAVVTGHVPVKDVSSQLTKEKIVEKLIVLNTSLKQDFAIVRPRIAVLGLNPHAGDNGVIGNEEAEIIALAIREAEEQGILCFGPYPADGFFGAGSFNQFDAVLAMYHDQGLIPFKTLSMETGVNYTAGLPVIRTSPDHGTAYDIAGQNKASEESFRHAIYLACDIHKNRTWHTEITANPFKPEKHTEQHGKRIE